MTMKTKLHHILDRWVALYSLHKVPVHHTASQRYDPPMESKVKRQIAGEGHTKTLVLLLLQ